MCSPAWQVGLTTVYVQTEDKQLNEISTDLHRHPALQLQSLLCRKLLNKYAPPHHHSPKVVHFCLAVVRVIAVWRPTGPPCFQNDLNHASLHSSLRDLALLWFNARTHHYHASMHEVFSAANMANDLCAIIYRRGMDAARCERAD